MPEEAINEFSRLVVSVDSDDDTDLTCMSFATLAKKMENVTEDGKIKKKIIRQGVGEKPSQNATVSIRYFSYLEYNDEPTDIAYLKKPLNFRLGTYGIEGLNIAIHSMKVNEKAKFLIGPEYAYGSLGHPPRIPPNTTFFFQIELLRFLDSGAALEYGTLTEDEKKSFVRASKTAISLMENAKDLLKNNPKLAIRDYNKALGLMEYCQLSNMEEQEEQQKIILRILTNLAISYNKDNQPKRACSMCNNIFNMVKNTSLKVPAKVYFNNGRALYMIGEYNKAKSKLLQAQKLEPQNKEISAELLKINEKLKKQSQIEKQLAKIYVQGNNNKEIENNTKIKEDNEFIEFRNSIKQMCEDLLESNDFQYTLPSGLTTEEYEIAKIEVEKCGLIFKETKYETSGKLTYYISKKIN